MSSKELRRRECSGVTSSDTVFSAISSLQINKRAEYQHPSELLGISGDIQEFSVQLSSPFFSCPDSIFIPVNTSNACKLFICHFVVIIVYSSSIFRNSQKPFKWVSFVQCGLFYLIFSYFIKWTKTTTPTASLETVKIPLTIEPCEAGQYNCSLVLKASNDIRVYHIECTIRNPNSEVEMEFTAPAHQNVQQQVPIVSCFVLFFKTFLVY